MKIFSHRYRDNTSALTAEFKASIKENGYTCAAMIPSPENGDPAGWTYTIGLTPKRLPELMVRDMPGEKAVVYLKAAADSMLAKRFRPNPGDTMVMPDDSEWTVGYGQPKATIYGVQWALRLYGERFVVRVLTLVPPPELAYRPGTLWPGRRCTCGCMAPPDPLSQVAHQVGTSFLP